MSVNALRNFNEKMLPLRWPEFTPPTIISMNAEQLERFALKHQPFGCQADQRSERGTDTGNYR